MPKNHSYKDITQVRFGRLVALNNTNIKKQGNYVWFCQCDCGNTAEVKSGNLNAGITKSFGCLNKESIASVNKSHGLRYHPAYGSFKSMHYRCYNEKYSCYENYGGRGITVCPEWHDLQTFLSWADSNDHKKGLHLDRIDVNKDYKPDNCRFITNSENQQNKRRTIRIQYENELVTVVEMSKRTGIKRSFIVYHYLDKHKTANEIINLWRLKNNV